jgi:uncharacterized membrane protein
MSSLIVAAVFLVGTHFGIASTSLREQLIGSIGEGLYRALYSLVAIVAVVWLVLEYRAAPMLWLWHAQGTVAVDLPVVLMPFALLLVVCALTAPNPTALGQAPDADATEPARGILRITRHPLMWGVTLWAFGHIVARGDVASLIFFGAFAILGIVGGSLIDARKTRLNEPGWGFFLQRTSHLPFEAIIERRQKLVLREITLTQLALALGLYVVLIIVHPWLFGVAALG